MPHRKINPLIKLARIMPKDIDAFAKKYDRAVDKEKILGDLGDLMKLRTTNLALYANITLALGLNEQVEEETELHIRLHHANQGGADHTTDDNRTHALVLLLIQTYVDVSKTVSGVCVGEISIQFFFICLGIIYIEYFIQHQDASHDKKLDKFHNPQHPEHADNRGVNDKASDTSLSQVSSIERKVHS